jgi:S-(hydroxymethyl)glutathione dehydrogenase/alcohol dehydrogenase
MKTRAAVLYGYNEPIKVEEVELDAPKAGELRVKMVAAGVCHSDWHVVKGDWMSAINFGLPVILGHEGAGIVEEVGPGVTRFEPGDHVAMSFIPSCGHCKWCVTGHSNICDLGQYIMQGPLLDGTCRFHNASGQDLGQMLLLGTFAEHTVVPEASVVKIEKNYPLDKAALVSCGVTTGISAVTQRAKVPAGSTVLVLGIGGVGMNVVQAAAASGARMVIAADQFDHKLEWAKQFGATHTINVKKEDLVTKAQELTWGEGVNYAFEVIGTAETIGQAFDATSKGGTTVVVGVSPMSHTQIPVNAFILSAFEKGLLGTIFGSANPQADIPKVLQMYEAGKIKLDELITRTYKLEDVNEAYSDMLEGKNIRGVVMF